MSHTQQRNFQPSAAAMDSRSRSPYVIKACEECRRRKIRCNGLQPCRRCDRLNLACFYRAKRQHNSHPEQSVEMHTILAELSGLRADYEALASSMSHGSNTSGSSSPPLLQMPDDLSSYPQPLKVNTSSSSDPLLEISSEEMHRLLYVYDERVQFIIPVADIDGLEQAAISMDQHRHEALPERALCEADAACLRIALANAMAVDERYYGDLPARLFATAQPYLSSLVDCERLDVKALRAFALVGQYYYFRDMIVAAWRYVGFAVRAAEELGLSLRENVEEMFPDGRQRSSIRQLFWILYVGDHSVSVAMGFGPAVREVDPNKGIAEPGEDMPFLRAMVDCSRIVSRAWKVMCPTVNQIVDGVSLRVAQERLEPIYRQIREWQSSTAVTNFYKQPNLLNPWQCRCLKTSLYLRANELCIYLCKPILVFYNSLAENRNTLDFARTLAKDSISVLVEFNRSCSGMRVLPFCYNGYLGSALATLFLAIVQEPHRFNRCQGDCRASIFAAKELIEELERSDFVERKIYTCSRQLFAQMDKCRILGVNPDRQEGDDPEPASAEEFAHALKLIEPLFGSAGHSA